MPNRLRRRSRQNMMDALISLEHAFQAEAARQQRERIENARIDALREREAALNSGALSWPVTMMQEMQSHYGEVVGCE
jgi:hypothetical protein